MCPSLRRSSGTLSPTQLSRPYQEARISAHAQAQFRHAYARSRRRSAHHPGASRTLQARTHDGLPTPVATPPAGNSQSARSDRSVTARRNKTLQETDEAMSRPTLEVADIVRRTGTVSGTAAVAPCMAASQGARCYRTLPHCGIGRSSRSVRPLRPSGHLVQLMPQSALPEVPGEGRYAICFCVCSHLPEQSKGQTVAYTDVNTLLRDLRLEPNLNTRCSVARRPQSQSGRKQSW